LTFSTVDFLPLQVGTEGPYVKVTGTYRIDQRGESATVYFDLKILNMMNTPIEKGWCHFTLIPAIYTVDISFGYIDPGKAVDVFRREYVRGTVTAVVPPTIIVVGTQQIVTTKGITSTRTETRTSTIVTYYVSEYAVSEFAVGEWGFFLVLAVAITCACAIALVLSKKKKVSVS